MSVILIVDDSGFQRTWTKNALKSLPFEFVEAKNGAEALEMMVQHQPVLVLSDLNMPVMGGIEFMETMRTRGMHYPVVVLTADIQETTKNSCFELGALAVVHKPIEPSNLVSVITRSLARIGLEVGV